jgi:hypothetical protein
VKQRFAHATKDRVHRPLRPALKDQKAAGRASSKRAKAIKPRPRTGSAGRTGNDTVKRR